MTRRIGFNDAAPSARRAPTRDWSHVLFRDEHVLWEGTSRLHFRIDSFVIFAIAPALLYGIYLLYVQTTTFAFTPDMTAIPGTGGFSIPLDWMIFAAFGYLALYALAHGLTVPGLSRFIVTDRRALIRRRLPWARHRSYTLLPSLDVQWSGTSPGTISFERVPIAIGNNLRKKNVDVGFLNIDRAADVYDLVTRVQWAEATA